MTDLFDDILLRAIATYGIDRQLKKATEELAELIIEIQGEDEKKLIDEIADVSIMLRQLILIYGIDSEVERRIAFKVRRLEKRMDG